MRADAAGIRSVAWQTIAPLRVPPTTVAVDTISFPPGSELQGEIAAGEEVP